MLHPGLRRVPIFTFSLARRAVSTHVAPGLLTRHDHSIVACSRHIQILLFFVHIPFVVNHTFNATPTDRLQHNHFFCRSISWDFFGRKFGEIWAKTLRTSKTLPAPTPMIKSHWQVQFVNFAHCKKIVWGAFRNHTIFAKPYSKGSGCKWCAYHRTLCKAYNMYLQPTPFTKLFANAKRNNWLLLSELFYNKSPCSHMV